MRSSRTAVNRSTTSAWGKPPNLRLRIAFGSPVTSTVVTGIGLAAMQLADTHSCAATLALAEAVRELLAQLNTQPPALPGALMGEASAEEHLARLCFVAAWFEAVACADLWPDTPLPLTAPQSMTYDDITPRNCMPSLHTAWATAIFLHSRKGPRFLRFAGTFWLIATLSATLGFGYHYGADLVAGVVFALTVEAALRSFERGWDRSGSQLVAHGVTVFAALLLSYRYLPTNMAEHPWVAGPLILLAMISVMDGYIRTTRSWDPDPTPTRHPDRQLELA